ncbi:hypothetical protein [Vibrio agarivorans]|uniref:hypothetical protein n=1 Tax=Vibrio agarivorans TaxID=153622 RepID=UPI0025B56581|nr:hypothetical protein [Vibrio agarivorans]MDN3660195.1 hypothetical protein [Vibrio agarivorans]
MSALLRLTGITEGLDSQEVNAIYIKCMTIYETINDFFEAGAEYRYQIAIYDEFGHIISRKNLSANSQVSLAMCA